MCIQFRRVDRMYPGKNEGHESSALIAFRHLKAGKTREKTTWNLELPKSSEKCQVLGGFELIPG